MWYNMLQLMSDDKVTPPISEFTLDSKLVSSTKDIIFRFDSELEEYTNCFHLNYETGRYREDELVKLIQEAIPSFALTSEEYSKFIEERAISDLNKTAINRISKARMNAKGDYGELLLFLILEAFENAPKFVTKVKLRSSKNDQIKGFDCAHFTVKENDEVTLWLGEAKFHTSIYNAVAGAMESIADHLNNDFLRDELDILHDNIEKNSNIDQHYYDVLEPYLRKTKSLDDVQINVPVLLTYDSKVIDKATSHLDQSFIDGINEELKRMSKTHLEGKAWTIHPSVKLSFYFFPLKSVFNIKSKLVAIENALR